jgi:hypothetical protein
LELPTGFEAGDLSRFQRSIETKHLSHRLQAEADATNIVWNFRYQQIAGDYPASDYATYQDHRENAGHPRRRARFDKAKD